MPLVKGQYPVVSDEALRNGLTIADSGNAPIRSTFNRTTPTTDVAAALTTQVMLSVGIPLQDGDIVTKIAVQFGGTAADTPTNWWFALYDTSTTPALLGQTADQTTGAIAANSVKDLALTTPYQVEKAGLYYVGIMVKATTVPSVVCSVLANASSSTGLITGQKRLAQTSGSSLTTTAPATIATPTAVVNVPLVVVH